MPALGSRLVLASASPRRRDLLEAIGIAFEVVPSGFDESTVRGLSPRRQAEAAARGKAEEVAARRGGTWVLGCDTVVAVGPLALGQPVDDADARRILRLLAGRSHTVISSLWLRGPDGRGGGSTGLSRVRIADLSDAEIDNYVAGGEPRGKAGAYAIQGEAGDFAALERGRAETVIGLPTHLLIPLLTRLGHAAVC